MNAIEQYRIQVNGIDLSVHVAALNRARRSGCSTVSRSAGTPGASRSPHWLAQVIECSPRRCVVMGNQVRRLRSPTTTC